MQDSGRKRGDQLLNKLNNCFANDAEIAEAVQYLTDGTLPARAAPDPDDLTNSYRRRNCYVA